NGQTIADLALCGSITLRAPVCPEGSGMNPKSERKTVCRAIGRDAIAESPAIIGKWKTLSIRKTCRKLSWWICATSTAVTSTALASPRLAAQTFVTCSQSSSLPAHATVTKLSSRLRSLQGQRRQLSLTGQFLQRHSLGLSSPSCAALQSYVGGFIEASKLARF